MREQEIKEGLGELADVAERDHEVQMARAELYKIAKYAIKLHEMLKGVSEAEGLEGWVQSKITKSASMIGSVYHHLDYEKVNGEINNDAVKPEAMGEVTEGVDNCAHCGCEVGNPKPGCDCKEDCHSPVKEGKYKNDAQRKAVHASKDKKDKYKESLQSKLSAKLKG